MKYKRRESTKAELLRMVRNLFKQNIALKRKVKLFEDFKKLMAIDTKGQP